ncbi:hypothetical protein BO94DRAFT_587756 [Aspergillus sclerotioniger CBS 115572]|uniref:Uncharacterized protein n=1 Tax=Aspergillus sclerotioniger CBS 115572 TaxID=1450535 RepID=A0A317W5H9_9EURO|nr:hypothetical protein BO94DRAFT_587756 [Aspergillus sclerotioniger CBS 115572]PWY80298.1 hypothetical protein BO94DRAFT_587756 [Aspergillus sclerotioniger CBS 115572]
MSACTISPKQILKRELSQREYELLQEWAPETLKDYTLPKPNPPMNRLPQYQTVPSQLQGPSPRRSKVRSSSVYEEWKSQASHGRTVNETPTMAVSKENQSDATVSPTNARVNSNQPGSPSSPASPASPATSAGAKLCPQEPVKIVTSNNHYAKPTVSTSNRSMTSPVSKMASKAGEHSNKTKGLENRQRPRQDIIVYTAPNGCKVRRDVLSKWSLGIKTSNKLTIYFRPNFVEDPWKGLKPVLTISHKHWW